MLTDEFRKAKSPSITYDGKTVVLYDVIYVPKRGNLLLRFHGVASEWRQGIRLGDMSPKTDLRLTVAGQTAPGMMLWEDTSPSEVEIAFSAPQGVINVYNIWDIGDGQSTSQLMGAGMHLEVSDDGKTRTYRCNDGHLDTTFSHLMFSLEVI
ncbi:MAG: hypothetical protein K8S55_10115 [Phycisphaerae bacterium]|nr:hypothetical protein [Phycisphaerae bacterium]